MDIQKKYIYDTTLELISDIKLMTSNDLDIKYSEFKTKFPKVYENCITSGASDQDTKQFLRELNNLLNIREDVKSGKKSDVEANVQVSEHMAKQYLYPVIGEPSKEQKKNALNKILKKHDDDMKDYDPNVKYE